MADFRSIVLREGDDRPYLGSRDVVYGALADLVRSVAEDPQATEFAIETATAILYGRGDSYAPMGRWNGRGIGNWIRGNMTRCPRTAGRSRQLGTRCRTSLCI